MKTKICLLGSAVSALLACLCAAVARHDATSAYRLWLSQTAAENPLVRSAARANHLWAATMLGCAVFAGVLLWAGLRRKRWQG